MYSISATMPSCLHAFMSLKTPPPMAKLASNVLCCALLSLALSVSAFATENQLVYTSDKVGTLAPSYSLPTLQKATFTIRCDWTSSQGYGLAGYVWSYAYPPPDGTTYPENVVYIDPSTKTNRNATGFVFKPGVFRAICGIRRQHPGGYVDPEGSPSIFISVNGDCAAIGRPNHDSKSQR